MKKLFALISLVITVTVLFTSCSNVGETEQSTAESTTETSTTSATTEKKAPVYWEVEQTSTVYRATSQTWEYGVSAPTIIRLEHNGEANGTLLSTFVTANNGIVAGETSFRVMASVNDGKSWSYRGSAIETIDDGIEARWAPYLFELPCQVGDMPEGTILLSGNSVDDAQKERTSIVLFKSLDLGKTWTEIAVIDSGNISADDLHSSDGVWEPYICYEDGWLYCFYSDEGMTEHSQAIVYRRSRDGINWIDETEVVASDTFEHRPGMASVTKMGNGKYFICYEIDKYKGLVPIYCKTSDSLTSWNVTDFGKCITSDKGNTLGSAPRCIWSPAGGECGTLIVSAGYGAYENIFVSYDYGETFKEIPNPLSYEGGRGCTNGKSPCFFLSEDGKTLYYVNAIGKKGDGEKARIGFARVRLCD